MATAQKTREKPRTTPTDTDNDEPLPTTEYTGEIAPGTAYFTRTHDDGLVNIPLNDLEEGETYIVLEARSGG